MRDDDDDDGDGMSDCTQCDRVCQTVIGYVRLYGVSDCDRVCQTVHSVTGYVRL